MATVRAKCIVEQVSRTTYGHSVKLRPVTSGSDENRSFYAATPGGMLELVGLKQEVIALFGEPGAEFYVDFTKAGEAPS